MTQDKNVKFFNMQLQYICDG